MNFSQDTSDHRERVEAHGAEAPLKLSHAGFLLLSYGAPEGREDVVPFLEKLFEGKNVPPKRIEAAAEKYFQFARQTGHFSPLNEECRALLAGVLRELNRKGDSRPVYWGNLYWHPLLEDTVAEMARDGITHAHCFATSAFDCLAGNQYYVDALEAARSKVGPAAPILDKLPLPFDHPLFVEAQSDRLLEAMAWTSMDFSIPPKKTFVFFTAHSIPSSDESVSNYVSQLTRTCEAINEKCGPLDWELVWQSRSGGVAGDWLGPDVKDRIRQVAQEGRYRSVVVSPIGFFCENMETVNDLDLEVGALCGELGIDFARARTVGAAPKICRMIRELIFS